MPLLQVALNGDRQAGDHPAVPITAADLARDAVACVAAGAGELHLHPRDAAGREALDAATVDAVVRQVHAACGVPVGVTTGAWIVPDLTERLALIRQWQAPAYTSVNLSEPGSLTMIELLLEIGIGVEAGVWDVADAELLGASGFGPRVTRVLVEPGELQVGTSVDAALALVAEMHATLDRYRLTVPRLQHGDGVLTWPLLCDAVQRGLPTRIGLEDTLSLPDGTLAAGNLALVQAARALGAG